MGKKSNDYICKCYKLDKSYMKDKIKDGASSFKELQKESKIGTKCSSCKKKNKKRFQKYTDKVNETPA